MKKMSPAFVLFISMFFSSQCFLSGQFTSISQFSGTPNGNTAWGPVVSDGTFLYGMTMSGGANNLGCIYKLLPDGTGYSNLFDFADTSTGTGPWGGLLFDGTYLYGMTELGGATDEGALFKIKTDGTGFVKLLNFTTGLTGAVPHGTPISDGTFLYGMTTMGGVNGTGNIFKIMPDGSSFINLFDFGTMSTGINPNADLFYDGTFLYGTTYQGGANNQGAVFKIMPDGSGFTVILDFDSINNGCNPTGNLISDGTFLYGMTNGGGLNGMGIIFKIMPDGTGFVNLLDFSGVSNGNLPRGGVLLDGTDLYGTAETGGLNNMGTLFKIKTDGTGFVKLFDFSGIADGNSPYSSLISDGQFLFGTTVQGGASDLGTVFRYQYCPTSDIIGNASYSGGNVTNGFVVIYPHDTAFGAFDTLQIQPLDASGNYHFINVPAGDYLIKVYNDTILFPTITSTYFGDQWVWDSAAVFHHDCFGTDTANIAMIELNLGGGIGLFHGQIIEGYGYGRTPGDPIPGIHVLVGLTGSTQLIASTVTDANGNYTFTNKPLGSYSIYVDIPGLERNSTHVFTVDSANPQILCLDFVVDSSTVTPVACEIGIDQISSNPFNVEIIPNPFIDYTTLHMTTPDHFQIENCKFVIYDLYGRQVTTRITRISDAFVINRDSLPGGIYFYEISHHADLISKGKLMIVD